MAKTNQNRILREQLGNFCYLGGIINNKNMLTIHEIDPKRFGGRRIYVNTALLGRLEHDMNNVIEREKPKIGNELAYFYHYIRETRDLEAVMQMREFILKEIDGMDYEIEDRGKILTLRKRIKK